jgi:hypothetical protein
VSSDRAGRRAAEQRGAHVWHNDAGPRSVVRLAEGGGGDPCRHGKHRRLLASGLAVLEGHFDLIVGNARHIRNVPGRKTDVKDAEWIADLVRHGLIAKSFVPPAPLRDLRELLRYRRKLMESQAAERTGC